MAETETVAPIFPLVTIKNVIFTTEARFQIRSDGPFHLTTKKFHLLIFVKLEKIFLNSLTSK